VVTTRLSARDIADYFLTSVDEEAGDNLTNLKLQKLVYYAQGLHLAITGEPLFDDEIVAWQHGPVVPTLYRAFKQHGAEPIPRPDGIDGDRYPADVRDTLDDVQTVYGQFSASKLRNMTHAEPPYRSVAIGETISRESMREYFRTQLVDG
jgi:uncharacterized phage-associated protein